ncbi:MAG: M24 family metallopeptidase [Desulfovibrionaceae bacterium]
MFRACASLPHEELALRLEACRGWCARLAPEAGGMLVFSRLNIYYLTGTLAEGALWLPLSGAPLLLARRGAARCRLESPSIQCRVMRNMRDIPAACAEAGMPLASVLAVDMAALSWAAGERLHAAMRAASCRMVPGDGIFAQCRARKTPWELEKMRLAGARHHHAVHDLLPRRIHAGMSEYEIGREIFRILFSLGHCGLNRMGAHGEEVFLGHVAAGANGNYPSHFNGPLGLKGIHPATPFMGDPDTVWQPGTPLAVDVGFTLEGYHTDKTQCYWAGPSHSIPDAVRRAHDDCVDIQRRAAEALRDGAIPSAIWREAEALAAARGWEAGFMGLGGNKVPFLGHGIGLVIDEWPVLARRFDAPLESGMVLAIEPKIGIPGVGMVGVENTFVVTPHGGESLTGMEDELICVEQ